jgi:hypothetical protein
LPLWLSDFDFANSISLWWVLHANPHATIGDVGGIHFPRAWIPAFAGADTRYHGYLGSLECTLVADYFKRHPGAQLAGRSDGSSSILFAGQPELVGFVGQCRRCRLLYHPQWRHQTGRRLDFDDLIA